MQTKILKTLVIDTENGIYELNGRSFGSGCSEFCLKFENGEWSLVLTEDSHYSTSDSRTME